MNDLRKERECGPDPSKQTKDVIQRVLRKHILDDRCRIVVVKKKKKNILFYLK